MKVVLCRCLHVGYGGIGFEANVNGVRRCCNPAGVLAFRYMFHAILVELGHRGLITMFRT